jgi:hypothetical protein
MLGYRMVNADIEIPYQQIPGYRGYISVFLCQGGTDAVGEWFIGVQPQAQAYSFEISTWPPGLGSGLIGFDVNPTDVLYEVMTGKFAKLGIDTSLIDTPSWNAAASIFSTENNGYSRCFDQPTTALEVIQDVLQQTDCMMFEDPSTGTFKLKPIRADYDPNALPIISPANCKELQDLSAMGWTDIANRVIVKFLNKDDGYKEGQGVAESQANAVRQDGDVNEITLTMYGITNQATADQAAQRELQARSRPMMKCRAMVDRSHIRLLPGDTIALNWPEANISRAVMRVTGVGRGTLEDVTVPIDLVQDSFYQWRRFRPVPPHLSPGPAILGP